LRTIFEKGLIWFEESTKDTLMFAIWKVIESGDNCAGFFGTKTGDGDGDGGEERIDKFSKGAKIW